MEAQQTVASGHFNSPAPDTSPEALASATWAQTVTVQYCKYMF